MGDLDKKERVECIYWYVQYMPFLVVCVCACAMRVLTEFSEWDRLHIILYYGILVNY
jgi:hypothetical protein